MSLGETLALFCLMKFTIHSLIALWCNNVNIAPLLYRSSTALVLAWVSSKEQAMVTARQLLEANANTRVRARATVRVWAHVLGYSGKYM